MENESKKRKDPEAKQFQIYLDSLKARTYDPRKDLLERNEIVAASKTKNYFLSKRFSDKPYVL
jgi:hypothetical protein